MSSHEFEPSGDTKKFTVTAFLAFAIVFAFVLLMSQCKGPFKPAANTEISHAVAEK